MARTKISEFSATAADNTDIDSIDIAEGCAPSGINNAIRELMAQLKDFQTGAAGDPFNGAVNGTVGATTPAAGTFTSLSDSGNLTFTGTGNRITGDFSNATAASRVAVQTSTTNGTTAFNIIPNGTGAVSSLIAFTDSTLTNASFGQLRAEGSADVRLVSSYLGTGTYLPMTFYTGGSERLRLDTSGNLGLGVTPSAWGAGFNAIDIGSVGNVYASSGGTNILSNAYYNGTNFIYKTTGVAMRYGATVSGSGSHAWFTAPSGTAGNAITFTQAMTLDASGQLGVGTTSPTANLHIRNTGGNATLKLEYGTGGTTSQIIGANNELSLQVPGASAISMYTNGSERARIDSSGNLLVGTTSLIIGSRRLQVKAPSGGGASAFQVSDNGNSGCEFYNAGGSQVGSITVNVSSTAYNTSSDYRLKENVAPMTGALAKVQQLKPVTYTWKADGSAGQGFIAHELQAVVPDCVTGEKDAVDEDGKPKYQGVDTSFLVATLVAAIQELKSEVDALKAVA